MKPENFAKTWERLIAERNALLHRSTNLETELFELRRKITHLNEAVNHLAPLAGMEYVHEDNISALGLTDAIRTVLKNSDVQMSPHDIRRTLKEKGYDLTGLSAPMASIYKILSRLADDSDEVDRV